MGQSKSETHEIGDSLCRQQAKQDQPKRTLMASATTYSTRQSANPTQLFFRRVKDINTSGPQWSPAKTTMLCVVMFAVFVVDVLCVLYPQPRVAQVRRSVDDFQLQLQLSLPGPEDWTRADGGATNFNESIELRCCWRRARLPFSSIQRSVKSRT